MSIGIGQLTAGNGDVSIIITENGGESAIGTLKYIDVLVVETAQTRQYGRADVIIITIIRNIDIK